MSELLPIEQAILCAADKIEKNPDLWIRRHYNGLNGSHCSIGWIRECYVNDKDFVIDVAHIETMLDQDIKLVSGVTSAEIVRQNDDLENDNKKIAKFLRGLVKRNG